MGTRIEEAVAQAGPGHGWRKVTARRLADAAARTCLARAGKEASDVDMLINAGVYREDSMGEPALATLIQEDIGANLGHPGSIGHGTFSFDAANGITGVLNAIHLQRLRLHFGKKRRHFHPHRHHNRDGLTGHSRLPGTTPRHGAKRHQPAPDSSPVRAPPWRW